LAKRVEDIAGEGYDFKMSGAADGLVFDIECYFRA